MTAGVAIGLALGWVAAVATNLGWLMKHRGAQRSSRMRHRRPWRSVQVLFASRWFTAGVVIASLGGLVHIAALGLAPISTVQAVMAAGIVTLGVLAERVFGMPMPGRQWTGVALTAAGLVLLAVTMPGLSGAHTTFSSAEMVIFDGVLLGLSGPLLFASRLGWLAGHDGALIGAASGVFFGISDVAIKAVVGVAGSGPAAILLDPWLAVAVITGLIAQYISARSLQTGDAVSVTALTGLAVNVANIGGGILLFGDPLASGLAGSLVEAAAFVMICSGAFLTPVRAAIPPSASRPGDDGESQSGAGSSPSSAAAQNAPALPRGEVRGAWMSSGTQIQSGGIKR